MEIDYNMSKEYCSDWSPIDAIREMVQNAIDSGQKYRCEIVSGRINIITYNKELPLRTLMLGESIKSGDSIGKYGEGYKIGMLVLTRENHEPTITNENNYITGLFSKNALDVMTFKLDIDRNLFSEDPNIQFNCKVGNINIDELKRKIPAFTGVNPKKPNGIDIWQDRQGEIFVNGLFVTENDKLVFGYNFSPNKIRLNRDRNMVNGLHWQLAEYYNSLGESKADLIFDLIERDASDVQDLSYTLDDKKLKAELARLFFNKYGEGATISKPGTVYVGDNSGVSCSSSASRVYSECSVPETKKTVDPESPDQVIIDWLKSNKKLIRKEAKVSLKQLIIRAKGWSKASIF